MCSFLFSRENFLKRNLVSWKGCRDTGVPLALPHPPWVSLLCGPEPSGLGGSAADHTPSACDVSSWACAGLPTCSPSPGLRLPGSRWKAEKAPSKMQSPSVAAFPPAYLLSRLVGWVGLCLAFCEWGGHSGFSFMPELDIRKFLRWTVSQYLVLVNADLVWSSCCTSEETSLGRSPDLPGASH